MYRSLTATKKVDKVSPKTDFARVLSSVVRTLELWIRIIIAAFMYKYVCVFCFCVVVCKQTPCDEMLLRQKRPNKCLQNTQETRHRVSFVFLSHKIEIHTPLSEHYLHITQCGCERNIRHKEEDLLRVASGLQANLRNLTSENRPRESL